MGCRLRVGGHITGVGRHEKTVSTYRGVLRAQRCDAFGGFRPRHETGHLAATPGQAPRGGPQGTVFFTGRRRGQADVLGPWADEADQTLVQRVQTGDAEAFAVLFRRYGPRVLRRALHFLGNEAEAEDVAQDVFLALYEKASTFRGDAALFTWLYRLTVNAALSRLRRRKRRPEVSMEAYLSTCRDEGYPLVGPDLEHHFAVGELHSMLHKAIEELQPLDKAVVTLSDLEELSNRDIGALLGLSVPAVKARLHRARVCLRGKLAGALGPQRETLL